MTPEQTTSKTSFDWRLYSNATFAGLSILIPLIPLDWLFEYYFRRRILGSIARQRAIPLAKEIEREMNRREWTWGSCLALPVLLLFALLKRLSRKILYFLTLKEATDALSHYWHYAFLYDYMLRAGHLESLASARAARQALEAVLADTSTSPLSFIARGVVRNARHVGRTLRNVLRRGVEDEVIDESRAIMDSHWQEANSHLEHVAQRYDEVYHQLRASQQIRIGEVEERHA